MSAVESALAPTLVEEALAQVSALAAAGDVEAYGRLVDATRGVVCAIAVSIVRDVAASEDVAQEVFLDAWRGLAKLRNHLSVLPWLRQLTRNRAHDQLRRGWRLRPDGGEAAAVVVDGAPDARAQLESAEEASALKDALDALPEASREVVTLFYREGQSAAQVAALLGLSEDAVKQRLSRARAALREAVWTRLGVALQRSAPTGVLTVAVTAALMAAGPAASAATAWRNAEAAGAVTVGKMVAGKTLGAAAVGAALGALTGAALGAAGVFFGLRPLIKKARTADERGALWRLCWVNIAVTLAMAGSIAVAAATRSRAIWFGGYGAGIAFMSWSYLVWLPRILAERHAAERAVDPTAAARQQRERRWRAASLLFGALTGSAAVVWAACNS